LPVLAAGPETKTSVSEGVFHHHVIVVERREPNWWRIGTILGGIIAVVIGLALPPVGIKVLVVIAVA
jgi:hypothetical protein